MYETDGPKWTRNRRTHTQWCDTRSKRKRRRNFFFPFAVCVYCCCCCWPSFWVIDKSGPPFAAVVHMQLKGKKGDGKNKTKTPWRPGKEWKQNKTKKQSIPPTATAGNWWENLLLLLVLNVELLLLLLLLQDTKRASNGTKLLAALRCVLWRWMALILFFKTWKTYWVYPSTGVISSLCLRLATERGRCYTNFQPSPPPNMSETSHFLSSSIRLRLELFFPVFSSKRTVE